MIVVLIVLVGVLLLLAGGLAVYQALRKPAGEDADEAYKAQADMRHSTESRPFDSTKAGP